MLQKLFHPPILFIFFEHVCSDPAPWSVRREHEDDTHVQSDVCAPDFVRFFFIEEAVVWYFGVPASVEGWLGAGFDLDGHEYAIWHLAPKICLLAVHMVAFDAVAFEGVGGEELTLPPYGCVVSHSWLPFSPRRLVTTASLSFAPRGADFNVKFAWHFERDGGFHDLGHGPRFVGICH